jgi:hypothetical protein
MLPEFCGQANAKTPRLHKMPIHPVLRKKKRVADLSKKRLNPPIRSVVQTYLSHFRSLPPVPLKPALPKTCSSPAEA